MHRTSRWGLVPRPLDRRPPLAWPAHLLIVGPGGLGDTIVALPALRQIRAEAPLTRITWIGPLALEPVLTMAGVDAYIASGEELPRKQDFANVGAVLTFVDFDPADAPHLTALSTIPLRIGSANGRKQRNWCNHLVYVKCLGRPRHEAARNLRLLIPFGVDPRSSLHELTQWATLPHSSHATPANIPTSRYIVLHPFSAGSAREWPVTHWIVLATMLNARGWSVVLTGSATESRRMAEAWPRDKRPPEVIDAFGQLDTTQLCGLLSRATAIVAASTGPLHLGAALGAPSLGLFVPRKGLDLSRWAPLGARALGVQARRHCARRCEAPSCSCIAALTPLTVAGAVDSMTRTSTVIDAERPTAPAFAAFAKIAAFGEKPR